MYSLQIHTHWKRKREGEGEGKGKRGSKSKWERGRGHFFKLTEGQFSLHGDVLSDHVRRKLHKLLHEASSLSTSIQGEIEAAFIYDQWLHLPQGKRKYQVETAISLSHISFPQWTQGPDRSTTGHSYMWKYPGKIPVTSKQSMVLGLFYNLPIILSLKQSDIYTWSKKKNLSCAHHGFPNKMREMWHGSWIHRQTLVLKPFSFFSCLVTWPCYR